LITPNTGGVSNSTGVLTGGSETLWVTYRLSNTDTFTNSLHSNYYTSVVGTQNVCSPDTPQNVAVRFGGEFPCLVQPGFVPVTTTTTTMITPVTTTTTFCPSCIVPQGFYARRFQILAQKVPVGQSGLKPYTSCYSIYPEYG
jgi:hypothetical protein